MAAGSLLARLSCAGALLAAVAAGACGDREQSRPEATPAARTPTATATPSPTAEPDEPREVAWTRARVRRRLAGGRVRIAGRRIPIDPSTLTCGGVGAPALRVGGDGVWTRFRCGQSTFPRGALVGPDAVFFVEPRGDRRFAVTGGRLTRY